MIEFLFQCWTRCDPGILGNVLLVVSHGDASHSLVVNDAVVAVSEVPDLFSDHEEADTRLLLHAHQTARVLILMNFNRIAWLLTQFVPVFTKWRIRNFVVLQNRRFENLEKVKTTALHPFGFNVSVFFEYRFLRYSVCITHSAKH